MSLGGARVAAAHIAEWIERRDLAIRDARAEGHSLREIAAATGLSKDTVATITKGNSYGVQ